MQIDSRTLLQKRRDAMRHLFFLRRKGSEPIDMQPAGGGAFLLPFHLP